MVAAVVRWLESLLPGDITLHMQLPSILSPLREVLNAILDGSARGSIWARLVAVGDALEVLIVGETLAHPSDVLAQNSGGNENPLMAAGEQIPAWTQAVDSIHAILGELPTYPTSFLPTIQEAAMNLVRGTSRLIPAEEQGQPGTEAGERWWHADRHHGLGDQRRVHEPPSPRTRGTRRPRSPEPGDDSAGSDDSHRRRRLLAIHMAEQKP